MTAIEGFFAANAKTEGLKVDDAIKIFPIDDGSSGIGFSVVGAELNGTHAKRVNHVSFKTYYLLSGSCTFVVDETRRDANVGDFVIVKPGENLEIVGKADMLISCAPPFDPSNES